MRLFHVVIVGIPLAIGVAGALATTSRSEPVSEHVSMQDPRVDTIDLIVGDTVHYAQRLRRSAAALALVSATPGVAVVTPAGGIVGRTPGLTVVTSSTTTRPRIVFRVKTRRQAINQFIPEVCANVDSQYFIGEQPVSMNVAMIHEYHDCQRLINPNRTYSSVIGIYASRNVQNYNSPADFTNGRLVALIVNFVGGKNLTYQPLGLRPGVNCLILKSVIRPQGTGSRASPPPVTWQAAIIPQSTAALDAQGGLHYGDCHEGLNWSNVPATQLNRLIVKPQYGVDMMDRPLAPPVARWDWDSAGHQNYMGVKCAQAIWCEIGPASGFTPSVAQRTSSNRPIFKGFYDEQFLSDPHTGSRPTSVYGIITPGADNHDASQMSARVPGRWYHASHLVLRETGPSASSAYAFYTQVFKTTPVSGSPRLSAIDFKLSPVGDDLGGYLGMYGTRQLRPDAIHFTSHSGNSGVVPSVRWRWKTKDEGTWSYCYPDGCCEDMLRR